MALIVLNDACQRNPADITADAVRLVREQVGAVAYLRSACVVDRLPKTRSGKTLRATIRAIADSAPFKMPATIDDPSSLELVQAALRSIGFAKSNS